MSFNEANTVEAFIRDLLCGGVTHHTAVGPGLARRAASSPVSVGTTSPTRTSPASPKKRSSRTTFVMPSSA